MTGDGMGEKDVLNVDQAAELLSVSPWTVREQARQGHLPGRKVGKEWRFSRVALLTWLAGGGSDLAMGHGRAASAP
ncbi:MAG: helix-turn-helix domain-containing protein [Chloroflexota bacterium]|nr:helix-turn-helix domain-containing protein [Chloroflexota bacterium]